ncbi:MAG: hypothetical protein JXA17_01230 [Dehalococcoidales bacterium]|nr:hypothetical protein [Dehalococcoidales bacterium]
MYKKLPIIITITLCLLLGLYSFMGLPPGTAAADDIDTSTDPEGQTANFIVSNLVIIPNIVEPSQIVSISVDVTNNGVVTGEYVLTLQVNDATEGAMTVTLEPGVTETFTFTLTGQPAGHYTVYVNGLTGSYEVTEPPPPITETTTPPPTTKIITQTTTDNHSSSTIILEGPPSEEEPLSWWLITIIVVGGLAIILVTWRLVRRAGQHTMQ